MASRRDGMDGGRILTNQNDARMLKNVFCPCALYLLYTPLPPLSWAAMTPDVSGQWYGGHTVIVGGKGGGGPVVAAPIDPRKAAEA